jgi:hypothetical protein
MIGSTRKVIVGGAELNFKRDRMEIQPLLSEPGISKLLIVKISCSQLRLPGRYFAKGTHRSVDGKPKGHTSYFYRRPSSQQRFTS